MKVMVTGNLGYVGSVVTARLAAAGHDVVGFDTGLFENCTLATPQACPRQLRGDIRSFDAANLDGIDAVVHLAAISNDPMGNVDASVTASVNTGGTRRIATAARDAGIRRFVFASSCSIYGASTGAASLDESAEMTPLTPYAKSKVDGEAILRDLADGTFRPIALRFATAYGWSARPRLDLVVNNLVASGLDNGVIKLESNGKAWRPLVHVEDMAAAILCALESNVDVTGCAAYNVGASSENYQVIEIAQTVAELLGSLPITTAERGADARSYNVNFDLMSRTFPHFAPAYTMRRGAAELAERLRGAGMSGLLDSDRFIRLRRIQSLQARGLLGDDLQWEVAPERPATIPAR